MNPESFSSILVKKLIPLGWTAVNWLFPPQCAVCGEPGTIWCAACQEKVHRTQRRVCPRCGVPRVDASICTDCRQEDPQYDWVRSWANYDPAMRTVIHQLKYLNNIALGEPLGEALADCYQNSPIRADVVTVVPISRHRRRKRGYNQALLIARAFCRSTGLPLSTGILRRVRQTESQVGKQPRERKLNVMNAFAGEAELAKGKIVLVIDDVFTTGATMNSCANALKKAGAEKVIGLTAARAGLQQGDTQQPVESWAFL